MANSIWHRTTKAGGIAACFAVVVLFGGRASAQMPALCSQTVNGTTVAITSGADFVKYVYTLKPFDFVNNGVANSSYVAPSPVINSSNTPVPIGDPYKTDMAAAFDAIPADATQYPTAFSLKAALCNLAISAGVKDSGVAGVFIDPEDQSPFAWSFWEVSGQGSETHRYVAVNAKLWRLHSGLDLRGLETLILKHLLGDNAKGRDPTQPRAFGDITATASPSEKDGFSPSHPPTDLRSPTNLALMAILAREVGLIIYHDHVAATSVTTAPPAICKDASGHNITFQSISWATANPLKQLFTQGHIQKLGEETNTSIMSLSHYQPAPGLVFIPSQLRQPANEFPTPSLRDLASSLALIYYGTTTSNVVGNNPEMADLLAMTTPYDDFTETFRLQALNDAGVSRMTLFIPQAPAGNTTPDVIGRLNSTYNGSDSRLTQKVKCISTNVGAWRNQDNWP